jgi:hypothetical protein
MGSWFSFLQVVHHHPPLPSLFACFHANPPPFLNAIYQRLVVTVADHRFNCICFIKRYENAAAFVFSFFPSPPFFVFPVTEPGYRGNLALSL